MPSRRATALAAVLLVRCGALLDLPDEPELAAKSHARSRRTDAANDPRHGAPVSPAGDATELAPSAPLGGSVDAVDGADAVDAADSVETADSGDVRGSGDGSVADAGLALGPVAPLDPAASADAGVSGGASAGAER